jgi:hypothetical protein
MSLKEILQLRLTGYMPSNVILHVGKNNQHCEEIQPWIVAIEPQKGLRLDLRPLFGCKTYILDTCHVNDLSTGLYDDLVNLKVECLAYEGLNVNHKLFAALKPRKLTKWCKSEVLWTQ